MRVVRCKPLGNDKPAFLQHDLDMKSIAMGVDIGGSHISCVAVDLRQGIILPESRTGRTVNNQTSATEIIAGWASALGQSMAAIDPAQLVGIGFAMPGPFNYAGGVALFTPEVAKYQSLHGVEVASCLRQSLALPAGTGMRFMNDASAFGVGEAWLGEAAGSHRAISITLGTGLGSVFIQEGIPVVEGDLVPRTGALWHVPFRGEIADAWFSTRWFISRYARATGCQLAGVRELAELAGTELPARTVFVEFGENLADFLAPWIRKFGAEVLVIGGNVSAAYPWFGPSLEASFRRQQIQTAIRVSKLREDAALLGSARLFEEKFWSQTEPLLAKM